LNFDIATWEENKELVLDLIRSEISESQRGSDHRVSPPLYDSQQSLQELLKNPISNLKTLLETTLAQSIKLHRPEVMGHQVAPPSAEAVAAQWFGDFMNYGMGVQEMGQFSAVLEEYVIQKMGRIFGFQNPVGGILTSGGSLGNLTALLVARNVHPDATFVFKKNAHYSNSRALKIIGIPAEKRVAIESWSDLTTLEVSGPLVLIASACSTALGKFDPIAEICDFAEQRGNCFVHVDAAHGGGAIFSLSLKSKIEGIERVDSLVFDFHKMALSPSLVTLVLYKKPEHRYATFEEDASYLWDENGTEDVFNKANQTIECTKPPLGLRAYTCLEIIGTKKLGAFNEEVVDLTQKAAQLIDQHASFQLYEKPEYNILVFECLETPKQIALRNALLEQGKFYITATQLGAKSYLRICIMNSGTGLGHITALLDELVSLAKALRA